MDQDLKAYLDHHFSSLGLVVQQQIQQLREETGQQFQQLRDDIAQLSLRLDRVEARLDRVEQRIDILETEVRKAHVLIEDLRGQIQLVAEGVANVNEKLDRHRGEVSQEIDEIKAFTRRAYEDLDVRIRRLEAAAG